MNWALSGPSAEDVAYEVEQLRETVAELVIRLTEVESRLGPRVIFNAPDNTQEECEAHDCSYFNHYLAYGGPDLTHEQYHAAERAHADHAESCGHDWANGPCPRCQRHEERVRA